MNRLTDVLTKLARTLEEAQADLPAEPDGQDIRNAREHLDDAQALIRAVLNTEAQR